MKPPIFSMDAQRPDIRKTMEAKLDADTRQTLDFLSECVEDLVKRGLTPLGAYNEMHRFLEKQADIRQKVLQLRQGRITNGEFLELAPDFDRYSD